MCDANCRLYTKQIEKQEVPTKPDADAPKHAMLTAVEVNDIVLRHRARSSTESGLNTVMPSPAGKTAKIMESNNHTKAVTMTAPELIPDDDTVIDL
jgi:hypothetical protein